MHHHKIKDETFYINKGKIRQITVRLSKTKPRDVITEFDAPFLDDYVNNWQPYKNKKDQPMFVSYATKTYDQELIVGSVTDLVKIKGQAWRSDKSLMDNHKLKHKTLVGVRTRKIDIAIAMVKDAVDALRADGLECDIVGGGGTGSYYFEGNSGVYNELQCGSYAFMDADYGRILDADGNRIDAGDWENSLFILTSVMSHAKADKAICDAGLKAQSVDSGLPVIYGRDDVKYIKCSDEHGVIEDLDGVLKINEKLKLVPGHCDPTCNVHDWYVGVRGGVVECIWPVSARGLAY